MSQQRIASVRRWMFAHNSSSVSATTGSAGFRYCNATLNHVINDENLGRKELERSLSTPVNTIRTGLPLKEELHVEG